MGLLKLWIAVGVVLSSLSLPALARETKAEREATIMALRRVLVGLEDASIDVTKSGKIDLAAELQLATRRFPESEKTQFKNQLTLLQQARIGAKKPDGQDFIALRDRIIAASGIDMAPAQTPDRNEAAAIYKQQCAACHGISGAGDGVLVPKMNPKPLGFADIKVGSPFRYLNILLAGRSSTVMPSYKEKHDLETLWGLAFYVASLSVAENSQPAAEWKKLLNSGLSLTLVAQSNDVELAAWLAQTSPTLAQDKAAMQRLLRQLRTQAPFNRELPRVAQMPKK